MAARGRRHAFLLTRMTPFGFHTAGRIRFGRGEAAHAAREVARTGTRVLVVRGRSVPWVDAFAAELEALNRPVATIHARGEPTVAHVEEAVARAREAGVDVVVAVGGGAVMDLGKAAAAMIPAKGRILSYLEGVGDARALDADPLPFIAIPTTAGTGSEVTRNAVIGVPEAGVKVSLRDDRMLARLAIVDPALSDGTPLDITLASGLDAVTQVIEPYLSNRANPVTDALCRDAIPMGLTALARLSVAEDRQARDRLAYVSLVGGIALANAGLGAVHGLAGVIGGRSGAPHGLVCGRLLGPVLNRNRGAEPAAGERHARYDQIAVWMAQVWDGTAQNAFDDLSGWLDLHRLARLDRWIATNDMGAIAQAAAASSSMKSNPVGLSAADLIRAMTEACGR